MADSALRARVLGVVAALAVMFAASIVVAQQSPNTPRSQQEWPRFERAVEVVRIQAFVSDGDGDFVAGLGVDDFELLVNGERRAVVDVLEMAASRPVVREVAETTTVPADRRVPVGGHRQFMIFLDLTDPNRTSFRNARATAVDFIADVIEPDDRLGLAVYSAATGLIVAVPFTSDHVQVERALESLSGGRLSYGVEGVGEGLPLDDIEDALGGDSVELIEEVELSRYALVVEGMAVGLQQLAETLRVVQGRKHVLFFSRGVSDAVFETSDSRGPAGFLARLGDGLEALRSADAVLYTLQPDILRGISDHDASNMQSTRRLGSVSRSNAFVDRTLLYRLAEETGGDSYWFRHRLRRGLEEIEERTRRYYVIAFQMQPGDPPTSAIELRLADRPGATVDAPSRLGLPGAFAEMNSLQRAMRFASALELGEERSDLALESSAFLLPREEGASRIAVLVQIPGSELSSLAGERGDERVDIELMGLVIGAYGNVFDVFQGRASASEIRGISGVAPLRYVNEVRVPPGSHHLKLLVRETGTDAMSVRSLRIDSRPTSPDTLVVAGPLPVRPAANAPYLWGRSLVTGGGLDAERPREAEPGTYPLRVLDAELSPDLDTAVAPGETRDFLLRVDGLTTHPFNGNVEWSLRSEVIGRGGRVLDLPDPEIVLFDDRDTSSLRLVLRIHFGNDLEVGPNELTVRALDRLTGLVAEGRWNFTALPR